ncbi:MAG: ASCH domain-containing protein [Nostoc sp.]
MQKTHRGYRIEFSKDGDKIKFIIFNENWVVRDYPWCKYDSLEEAELDAIDWLDKFHPGKKPTPPSKETLEQMSRAFYKERSQLDESVTQLKQSDVKIDLYICNSSSNIGKIIEVWQTCFTVDWSGEIKCYFWERDEQVISKLALAQPAAGIAPQALVEKFFSQGETLKRKVSRGDTPSGELCKKAITLHQPWAYLVGIYKFFETRTWSTNYRGKIAIHAAKYQKDTKYWYEQLKDLLPPLVELPFGSIVAIADLADCILMTEEFINQQSETELRCGNWKIGRYAWKLENVQILPEPIPTKGKQGLWNIELLIPSTQSVASIECTQQSGDAACPSCESLLIKLDDSVSGSDVGASGCGVCGWTPENFLEETEPQPEAVQKPKGRQRKGCLYKYIENKKLKSASIVSYPRVIGHRNPDNPTHWRWGFNWEEKVDGEWKGRSFGSVPVGAIALIQSMQKEGVRIDEIIGFIRRAKAKK